MKEFKLTIQALRIMEKNGYTIAEAAKKYGMTVEDFKESIRKKFFEGKQEGFNATMRHFEKNEKKKKQNGTKSKNHDNAETDVKADSKNKDDQSTQNGKVAKEAKTENPIIGFDETQTSEPVMKSNAREDEINALQEELNELKGSLFANEKNYAKLCNSESSIKKRLEEESLTLRKMMNEINRLEQEVNGLITKMNQIKKERSGLTEVNSSIRGKIETVEQKIAELSKKEVYVFESGAIEIDGKEVAKEITDEVQQIVSMFISAQIAEDLCLRTIKQLAKLYAMEKNLNCEYELVFEDDAITDIYEELKKLINP